MAEIVRHYEDGEIIFREGSRGREVFALLAGEVELLKAGPRGRVRLAVLSAGEVFGEAGVINRTTRSATARAVGEVMLEVIDQGAGQANVKFAADMITPRAHRRRAPERPHPIWNLIAALFRKKQEQARMLEVRLAPLYADRGGAMAERIMAGMADNKSLRVKPIAPTSWAQVRGAEAREIAAVGPIARQILVRDNADVVVWGALNDMATTISLRFVARPLDADHPGAFLPTDRLVLPTSFAPGYAKLLAAVAAAAATPRGEGHRRWLEKLLVQALEDVQESGQQPPVELMLSDRATIQTAYANVAATIGYHRGETSWYRQAAEAYREARQNLMGSDVALDGASVSYHLARIEQVLGERGRDAEALGTAANHLRIAAETFTQQDFPWEWANIHTALGALFYKLDSLKSDTELLKASVAAFQSSLLVFTKAETPMKWSDAKNGLGQALQMWGDAARNVELLQRGVQSCQEALQVRSREETPLLWAATQNNLGSALFLLGRLTEDSEYLEGAAEAFGKALEIYLAYGLARLSKITERNLMKAEDLLRARLARRVARVYWEDEPADERSERLERQRGRSLRAID